MANEKYYFDDVGAFRVLKCPHCRAQKGFKVLVGQTRSSQTCDACGGTFWLATYAEVKQVVCIDFEPRPTAFRSSEG